jgi:transposase
MRRLAVQRVVAGETQRAVAASLDMRETTVWKWMAAYRREGEAGLISTKSTGRPPALSEKQTGQLRRIIIGKNPLQLNFGVALWTLPIVRQLIEQKFGAALHETTVARTLHRLGLTPQKPNRRAFERDDVECRRWATTSFPQVVEEATRKQANLMFLDEAAVHEDGPIGTTWGARGITPLVRASGKRRRINVISAISPRGRLWFRCFKGTLTAETFIGFLGALLRDVRKKVVLVLDKHPAHTAAATRRFLLARADRITVHYLPSYAPDMNPDEHVWGHLKGMFRRDPVHEGEDFVDSVARSLDEIKGDRQLVKQFFERPEVAYVKQALNW